MMPLIRKSVVPALMLAASIAVAGEAMAAKEKFERTKPHVNVGTIGHVDRTSQQVWITVGLYRTHDIAGEMRSDGLCSGVLDLKLVDPTDSTGMPLTELTDVRLGPNQTVSAELPVRDAAAGPVNLIVVAREMEVDGRTCIFRGAAEVRDLATGLTTRLTAIKPAEFIVLRPEEEESSLLDPATQ